MLTASVAAWEGQIGQIPYASAKAGVVGMTLVAARDLATQADPRLHDRARHLRHPDPGPARRRGRRTASASRCPHPRRLGQPEEFARLALHIIDNPMLNGETIRLDGAIRMAPR